MGTRTLIVDFLIIGLFPSLALLFGILWLFGIYDLSFLKDTKDYLTPLILVGTLAMYLLGAITHNLCNYFTTQTWPCKWFFDACYGKPDPKSFTKFIGEKIPKRILEAIAKRIPKPRSDVIWSKDYVFINQSGSPDLLSRFRIDEHLLPVYKSVGISALFCLITPDVWLGCRFGWKVFLLALCVHLSISASALIASVRQRNIYIERIQDAKEVIDAALKKDH